MHWFRILLVSAALACAVVAPPAWAASSEDAQRAGQIQLQAKDAWDAGKTAEALRLAQRAISLDDGAATWLAQQIRIEALEEQGRYEEAMGHLRRYLRLDDLFPEHVAWGKEAKARIGPKYDAWLAAKKQREARRGIGAGLAIGGAVPLALGAGWLANYGIKTGSGLPKEDYEGFVDGGVAMLIAGGVMEGIGIALIASSADGPATAGIQPQAHLVVAPAPGGMSVGLTGRW